MALIYGSEAVPVASLTGVGRGISLLLTDSPPTRSACPQHAYTSLCKQGVGGSSPPAPPGKTPGRRSLVRRSCPSRALGETGWSSDGWGRDTELGELEKLKEASDAFHAHIRDLLRPGRHVGQRELPGQVRLLDGVGVHGRTQTCRV